MRTFEISGFRKSKKVLSFNLFEIVRAFKYLIMGVLN